MDTKKSLCTKSSSDISGELTLFKKAVDSSPLSIVITDKEGTIEYVNKWFCKLTGYNYEEVIGENPRILKSGYHDEKFYKALWSTLTSGWDWEGEFCNKKKNGEIYWERAYISPIKDNQGNIVHYIAIKVDISEEKKRDEQLKDTLKKLEDSKILLERILDTQESIVVVRKLGGETIYINKKFFEIFPFKDMEDFHSKYKTICELFEEEEGFLPRCKIDGEVYLKKYLWDGKYKLASIIDKDGNKRIFSVTANKINDSDLVVVTFLDVTELERARQNLIKEEKKKLKFFASISHEIRTPLNGIIGYLDLLSKTELSDIQKKYLSIINISTDLLLSVIDSVLDISKIETGKFEIEYPNINPYIELDKILSFFEPLAKNKKINYSYYIDYRLHEGLIVGIEPLKQIFMNLINNSLKFVPPGNDIDIKVIVEKDFQDKQRVMFIIKDTGIGIPEEKIKNIFGDFIQADTSIRRRFGGSGLGLSIVKALIGLMGGRIEVKSRQGEGTTFLFFLSFRKGKLMDKSIRILKKRKNICISTTHKGLYKDVSRCFEQWGISHEGVDITEVPHKKYEVGVFSSLDDIKKCMQYAKFLILIGEMKKEIDDSRIFYIHKFNPSKLYNSLFYYACEFDRVKSNTTKEEDSKKFKLSVLIAEDNMLNKMLMEDILKTYGVEFDFAENGKQALDKVRKNSYDLILMDVDMPVMDGFEASKAIKKEFPNLPIVVLSAHMLSYIEEKFSKIGINEFLTKPFTRIKLKEILEKYKTN